MTEGNRTCKRVAVIGCTGSVGSSALDVCRTYPEKFRVTALAADTGREGLPLLCREFSPRLVALTRPRDDLPSGVQLITGKDALLRVVEADDVDHIVFASSGIAAVAALVRALEIGKEISLANKESSLIVGDALCPAVRRGQLRPLDSEHNALWQCLIGEKTETVARLTLTASGGPFLRTPLPELEKVTPDQASAHPVWSMGRKISVDSATMINKGIELLEAGYLFGLSAEKIDAVIHPGSRVHAIVSYIDGATKLLMSPPDMRLPALTALSWPERFPLRLNGITPLDFNGLDLHFEVPERDRFPGYYTSIEVARARGPYPVILIAADEIAVRLYLEGRIRFTDIARLVAETLETYAGPDVSDPASRAALYERTCVHAREHALGREKKGWN